MSSILTDENFVLTAARYYNSPGCIDTQEFYEDLNRFKYIKKLFRRYKTNGDLKERLILNHIIVLNNIFGVEVATRLMFFRLDKYYDCLKPFLVLMGNLPEFVVGVKKDPIRTHEIVMDDVIVAKLRDL